MDISKYKYHFRPCYNSDDLLIEFFSGVENGEFLIDFLNAVRDIQPRLGDIQDLWMNDETLLTIDSSVGAFLLSKDIWGFAFITSEKSQQSLYKIDSLLISSERFQKVEVDFASYRTKKSGSS